ncbi:MAG: DUF72 domain-containing protein [Thermotogae bacterium]|nr:DUF72 domain-containing protein [Thermotogota bacterium]
MRIFVGTGGYSNEDWRGILYPEDSKPSEYLEIYSRYFNAVEVNITFYVIPGRRTIEGMVRKSGDLKFSVKLHRSMTHDLTATPEDYEGFFAVLEPMEEAGKLGVFLAQFPYSFKDAPKNRSYLQSLAEIFSGRRLAVEFRHESWDRPESVEWLHDIGLYRVSSDYPPLRKLPKPRLYVKDGFAYVRFHGRNTRTWWRGKDQRERHDYLYSYEELVHWVEMVEARREELSEIWLIFNNTTKGHALYNICMLKKLWPSLPTRIDELIRC